MLNSRSIDALRPDVAANCRIWIDLCRREGLDVLIIQTVRDEEYQRYLVSQGFAAKTATRPTFHSVKAGLAFDFCENAKGQEYSDRDFFRRAGELGEKVGFEWGGRWKSFVDLPHLQWSQGGKYMGSMILAGKLPPTMPIYKEDFDMTEAELQKKMDAAVKVAVEKALADRDEIQAKAAERLSLWASTDWAEAVASGIVDGTRPGGTMTREMAVVMAARQRRIRE